MVKNPKKHYNFNFDSLIIAVKKSKATGGEFREWAG